MTNMRTTSLEVYDAISQDGTLSNRQAQVLDYLEERGDHTNLEIADALDLPINCVTGRVNELCAMKKIESRGKKVQRTGKRAYVWGVKREGQLELLPGPDNVNVGIKGGHIVHVRRLT